VTLRYRRQHRKVFRRDPIRPAYERSTDPVLSQHPGTGTRSRRRTGTGSGTASGSVCENQKRRFCLPRFSFPSRPPPWTGQCQSRPRSPPELFQLCPRDLRSSRNPVGKSGRSATGSENSVRRQLPWICVSVEHHSSGWILCQLPRRRGSWLRLGRPDPGRVSG